MQGSHPEPYLITWRWWMKNPPSIVIFWQATISCNLKVCRAIQVGWQGIIQPDISSYNDQLCLMFPLVLCCKHSSYFRLCWVLLTVLAEGYTSARIPWTLMAKLWSMELWVFKTSMTTAKRLILFLPRLLLVSISFLLHLIMSPFVVIANAAFTMIPQYWRQSAKIEFQILKFWILYPEYV